MQLFVDVSENEIQTCISALVITNRKKKQEIFLFAAISAASICCIPHNGGANFISRPSQKFLSDISGMLQILYNLPLSAASAVTLRTPQIFVFVQL